MTYEDNAEARRPSVGTKVLMVGLAVFAVLGSFWTIVWFIRAYVEAPRVNIAPLALAARESTPVAPPAPAVALAPMGTNSQAAPPAMSATDPAPSAQGQADVPAASNAIADRWLPVSLVMAPPADPAPAVSAEPVPATIAASDNEPQVEDVAESAVAAISGAAPLPRRKPTQTAAIRPRNTDPPLPRPRPDGPAPQSVWTAVPVSDDRFPQQ